MPILELDVFSGNARRLFANFVSLSSIHVVNNVLSLLTVPYLARVLGPANYGLLGFITAFMTYFAVLTDYGFNLSATRNIACNRDNPGEVSTIYSTVMVIKLLLGATSFALLCGAVLFVDIFTANMSLYFVYFIGVVGNMLFPAWLFQGFEKMRHLSHINIMTRAFSTAAIFIFVNTSTDTHVVIWIYALSNLTAGALSTIIARKLFDIRFVWPSITSLSLQFKEGGYVFLSSAGTLLYTSSTTFILGLFASHEVVGYFTGADKIRMAVQGLFAPVFQTLYPYVSNLARHSRKKAWDFIKLEAVAVAFAGFAICTMLFVYADGIVIIILGEAYPSSADILRVLAILPALTFLGNVLTIQFMLSMGLNKEYLNIYALSSAAGLISLIALAYYHGAQGAAWAVVVAESIVVALTAKTIRATIKAITLEHNQD